MTVRWKPLLVLSGLFLVIAVVGVAAIAYVLVPHSAADILPRARAERAAKQYDRALIEYQRALQKDGRNPEIHEEMASLYGEMAEHAPAEKKTDLEALRIKSLIEAVHHGEGRKGPRRLLLADAMRRDVPFDNMLRAKELLALDPKDVNAHYVLAAETLEQRSPNIPEIKRHLAALEAGKASIARILWVKARLAQQTDDQNAMEEALAAGRKMSLASDADQTDRMAMMRLRALDVETTADSLQLPARVQALQAETKNLLSGTALAPARISRLSLLLERVQKALTLRASTVESKDKAAMIALVEAVDGDVEALFQRVLEASKKPDLQVYLTYADHLRFRQKREPCLRVVEQALKSPLVSLPRSTEAVLGLHAVAVEAALFDVEDKTRFEKAGPHIEKLIDGARPRYQGLGHLFQGAIDLELSGVAKTSGQGLGTTANLTPTQRKLRASAVNHLKLAAERLPDVAEAQARYGVALVLSQEQSLGRQYLGSAIRLGNLDPQYQIWAAWSMVQAGYPEAAAPIVAELLEQVKQGKQPGDLALTLHTLNGEIHQARRAPNELQTALAEYEHSTAPGKHASPVVQLRMAQIEVQLGQYERALKRIDDLRKEGQGGPPAEHLAVLTLQEQGKADEALDALQKARARYPKSDELVALEAALLARNEKPKEADRVLSEYLAKYPDNVGIILTRAQLLTELLGDTSGARKLLVGVADRSDNSGPLVQLALLDLRRRDYDAVEATIAKIRSRWKEAAVGDLLEAQLALEQGDSSTAVNFFDAALKKDPGNKLVQFWKAQLDSRNGATKDAIQTLDEIARTKSTKEVDTGLSLMDAAQSALAGIALQTGDVDGAIRRLEDLRGRNQVGGMTRADRWQLVTAYVSKGQWSTAKSEIAALLNDAKNPPTADERVRGANFYRLQGEDDAALAQLDYVIRVDPAHPPAIVTRSYILARAKKPADAIALLRKAIATAEERKEAPPAVFYLMLAAIESSSPPNDTSMRRALTTLDEGLKAQGDSPELVNAKYRVLLILEGDKAALSFVEEKAKKGSKLFRRMLVEVYGEQKEYAGAERVLRELRTESPKDARVADNLVRVLSLWAANAAERGNRETERSLNDKVSVLIREFRTQFPNDLAFLQAECDLAARRGDLARAADITKEMDRISKNSPSGALLRARIYAAQGRTREVADAYAEALERNPRQLDVRILLGQADLKLGETDEALRQAKAVLDLDHDQPDAILLRAQALAGQLGPRDRVSAQRTEAINLLDAAIKRNPKFRAAYHLKSEVEFGLSQRDKAIKTLKEDITAVPEDANGLSLLLQRLTEPRPDGSKPTSDDMTEAKDFAEKAAERDRKGNLLLAIAVGFHKAGEVELALPWARKAAEKLDSPMVHLNYGDLLLTSAENAGDAPNAKELFRRAVEQYDLVLKAQANSVEAINNKAWILLTYLGQTKAALELATGLANRVDPATLPAEFFDTLGAIQEANGRARDAEDSYTRGLRKAPDHPVLNYHMGKLIAGDRSRSRKAATYLQKALEGKNRLTPAMLLDLNSLMRKLAKI